MQDGLALVGTKDEICCLVRNRYVMFRTRHLRWGRIDCLLVMTRKLASYICIYIERYVYTVYGGVKSTNVGFRDGGNLLKTPYST